MSARVGTAMSDHVASIGRLDLPTKVKLLTGASAFTLWPEDSLQLGELRFSDGPTGVRGLKFSGGRTVTLFPNATLLASTWSEEIACEFGRLLAEEALAQQIHVVLGPTINLHRTPLGGRLFEAYSEDPLLTGKLAGAYVRGMQELGVAACLKHLIANESETDRTTVDSIVDEATLRELYLLPFEIAVEEANPWSIMAAYNAVNGVTATEQHHVNNEIVKTEWGYSGLIMSDWFATRTAAPAANGGLDLVMPGPDGPWGAHLVAAVSAGLVDESVIDEHLRRLVVLADRVGALGERRSYPADIPSPDSDTRRHQLTHIAAAGITVLTNRERTLPLNPASTVALIGRHAIETVGMGGGSAQVNPPYQRSVAEGLTQRLGDLVVVTDGVEVRSRAVPARPGFVTDPVTGQPGVRFVLRDHHGAVIEERVRGEATTMVGFDDDFDDTVHRIDFQARINRGGSLQVGAIGVGQWTLKAAGQRFEFVQRVSGDVLAEEMLSPPTHTETVTLAEGAILEGSVLLRPTGDHASNSVAAEPAAPGYLIGLIARTAPRPDDDVISAVVTAAENVATAVVVVGLTEEEETESVDKVTLRLPGRQDDLVSAVAAVARRTVVVVNAATPVLMPWLNEVDAILWAGLPGQEGGHAVAAALLGEIEPAGRLVTSFPVADDASPAWSVTPVEGQLHYEEGPFIGYRGHYAGRSPQPLFWLGHGLGYSTWDYHNAHLEEDGRQSPTVAVSVTNTGDRDSREVVQVYLEPSDIGQPVRLVGWTCVSVPAQDTIAVTVPTDARLWRRWDTNTDSWNQLSPGGKLLIARGLGDIRAEIPMS